MLQNLLYLSHVIFFFISSNFAYLDHRVNHMGWVFSYKKYSKFWSVLLEHLVEHKPIFLQSEAFSPYTTENALLPIMHE